MTPKNNKKLPAFLSYPKGPENLCKACVSHFSNGKPSKPFIKSAR